MTRRQLRTHPLMSAFIAGVWLFDLVVSPVALASSSGKVLLEQRIQSKLDRILTPDEYFIDIKMLPDPAGSGAAAPSTSFLPGLQILGPVNESGNGFSQQILLDGKADLLIIFDKKVSQERTRVAQDMVSRTLDAEGLKNVVRLSTQQKDINKIPPPDRPPFPPREPSLLEQIIREKDFIVWASLVLWGAFVSLMAIFFLLRRVLSPQARTDSDQGKDAKSSGRDLADAINDGKGKSSDQSDAKQRDKLFAKEEALANSIKEVASEAREQPQKVARILSRWVSNNDDLAKAGALLLRNCDIKTVEKICSFMHPSDLDKIFAHKIEDFDAAGQENQRVIDRMRADLAVLASEHVLKEKPDPLSFLRTLSDDDIRSILDGESAETIALVATQIPAHRLRNFYDKTNPEKLKEVMARLSTIEIASVAEFERLRADLYRKAESLANNLFSEKDRIQSLSQMVTAVVSPVLQCELLERLRKDNTEAYSAIRPSLLVATDLRFLPARVKSVFIQSIDPDTCGTALSGFDISFDEFMVGLPETYQSVFSDAQRKSHDSAIVNAAWRKIVTTLGELNTAGLISRNEIAATTRRADEMVIDSDKSDDQGDSMTGESRGAA
jgi:flagellar motor switch protein FliG